MEDMEIVEAVQRMQDYIDNYISDEITLNQLAKAAGYSPWYSSKIFKKLLGKTPFEYIRSLRLSKAAQVLQGGNTKIIDVALDFVFDSHEGFTRAFSKQFGMSPKKYSQDTPPIQLFLPSSIHSYYLNFLKTGVIKVDNQKEMKTLFVQVIERPERKVMLKRGITAAHYFAYCEEVGCDVWGILTSVKEALYEPIGMWLPKHLIKEGTSEYVQGVELPLDYNNLIPAGFEIISLPPCKMMVFQGDPYDDEIFNQAVSETISAIDKYNPEIYGFEWAKEEAPRFQLQPMGYRGYIEARPVKEIKHSK
jgi:AraC-like DNA-binding protein